MALDGGVGTLFSLGTVVAVVTEFNDYSFLMDLLIPDCHCLGEGQQNSKNCHDLHNVLINI